MKKYFFLCFVLLNLLQSQPVFAVNIFFESNALSEKRTQVDVFLDTQSEAINAVEGRLNYDVSRVHVSSIYNGNSIINFWVQNPEKISDGVVRFSGITPGGFSGTREFLFSLIFERKEDAFDAKIFTKDVSAFKNDGKGTRIDISSSEFSFLFLNSLNTTSSLSVSVFEEDNMSPEPFSPVLSHDENIFEGKWFVSFATQDKGKGIQYYEVCEKGYGCEKGNSPFLLKNQTQERDMLFVRAVDVAGNIQVGKVQTSQNFSSGFDLKNIKWVFFVFGIFGILMLLFVLQKKYGKKK